MSAPGFSAPTRSAPYSAADVRIEPPAGLVDPAQLREPVDPQTYVSTWTRPLPEAVDVFSGPGYESRRMPASPFAVIALVCGLLGFLLVPALPAIVLGHLGVWQTGKNTHTGRGLAVGGMVLGYAVAGLALLWLVAVWVLGDL